MPPAYEDGTDRVFRNVGIYNSDAGELPKRKHNIKVTSLFSLISNTYFLNRLYYWCTILMNSLIIILSSLLSLFTSI